MLCRNYFRNAGAVECGQQRCRADRDCKSKREHEHHDHHDIEKEEEEEVVEGEEAKTEAWGDPANDCVR